MDAARGRGDARPELLLRLATAPAAYLEGACSNPALDEEGVALLLKRTNHLERKQHHRAIRPAVESRIPLAVAVDAVLGNQRLEDAGLRDAAA